MKFEIDITIEGRTQEELDLLERLIQAMIELEDE